MTGTCGYVSGKIYKAHGGRVLQDLLLKHLQKLLKEKPDAGDFGPVRIVVPSASLRIHLSAQITGRLGAVAGLRVQTLHSLAREVVERGYSLFSGDCRGNDDLSIEPFESYAGILPILVERSARENVLWKEFEDLDGPFGILAGTVRDLLDAGFHPAQSDALKELLLDMDADKDEIARAIAVIETAERVLEQSRKSAVRLDHELPGLARRLLQDHDPETLYPTRCTLVYGFSNATGEVTELLRVVVGRLNGSVYLDKPRSAAWFVSGGMEEDGGESSFLRPGFSDRFEERLSDIVSTEAFMPPGSAGVSDPPELEMFCASSPGCEIRETARRIRKILETDRGVTRPETIGVVAREPDTYCMVLRREFSRLALPFSGGSAPGPRRAGHALVEAVSGLLQKECKASVETWLNSFHPLFLSDPLFCGKASHPMASDILAAFRGRGITRLRQVVGMCLDDFVMTADGSGVLLPSRLGFAGSKRTLDANVLSCLLKKASDLVSFFESIPERSSFAQRVNGLRRMLESCLGWSSDDAQSLASELAEEMPSGFELSPEDFSSLFAGWAESNSAGPLGGKGGGVQVLSVIEARGHTFEHLFLVGMKRGIFPRTITTDALIADEIRGRMRVLLPDLPVKADGYEEERYLFEQLLHAAPRVTLSYHTHDESGSAVSRSPFLEQLLMNGAREPECAADIYDEASGEIGRDNEPSGLQAGEFFPAFEHAVKAGLTGRDERVESWLVKTLEQDRCILPMLAGALGAAEWNTLSPGIEFNVDPSSLAKGRIAVLKELEPDLTTAEGAKLSTEPGPYQGFVSKPSYASDPRNGRVFITTLEGLARCPWQVFVTRILRVDRTLDPLESLPDAGSLIIGKLVHEVLAGIAGVDDHGSRNMSEVLTRKPKTALWPNEKILSRMNMECARDVLKEDGINMPGLALVAARQALPYLERCREIEWSKDAPEVLGAELQGEFTAICSGEKSGTPRKIYFRVDRVDRKDDEIILIDYKTGKAVSKANGEDTILKHYLKKVKGGRMLQAQAYEAAAEEMSAGHGAAKATGRYVYIKPGLSDCQTRVDCGENHEEFRAAFNEALSNLLELWDSGVFFPKAAAEDNNNYQSSPCSYCSVAEACLRGDSGFRSRLKSLLEKDIEDVSGDLKAMIKLSKMGKKK